jgi:hypothetical protein
MSRLLTVACCVVLSLVALRLAPAQEPQIPMPGPEHTQLKKMEGTWDAAIKLPGDQTAKGEMTCKMECGGLWLVTDFKGDFGGLAFQGKGLDGYDAKNKKYVSVWVDSMSARPMQLEGTYDGATKTLTMIGEGPDMGGEMMKYKNVTQMESDDRHVFKMYELKDGGENLMMTVEYTRRKE